MKKSVTLSILFFCVVFITVLTSQNSFSHSRRVALKEMPVQEDRQEVELEGVENDIHIVVNVAARQLFLYEDDVLVKQYQIAVGATNHQTPIGKKWMQQIVWNPWWIPPKSSWAKNNVKTPPGPRNPLGPVKMVLGNAILIHGTSNPRSIGSAASHGCMRMYSYQAKDLARWIQEALEQDKGGEVFSKYEKHKKRSYYVSLEKHIPVDIVYEVADLRDDTLFVYQDVYSRHRGQKMNLVKKALKNQGYDPDEYDLDFINSQLKLVQRADFAFDLDELKLDSKKKKKKKNRKKYAMGE